MTATDDLIERILRDYDTITVVGASVEPAKAAHDVPAYMQHRGWRIIPVNPHADEILGEPVYRTLADVPEQVGLVDVFRPAEFTPDIARQAVAAGAVLLAAGAAGQRAVLPHARVVLHQPAAQGRGTIPDLILQADEVVRVRSDIEGILARPLGPAADSGDEWLPRDKPLAKS